MFFTFIAYKPMSSDYCRGCHMTTYNSHHIVENMLPTEDLITRWAEYLHLNMNLDCNEVGYGFWIFADGEKVWDEYCSNWDGRYRYSNVYQDEHQEELEEKEKYLTGVISNINEKAQVLAKEKQLEQEEEKKLKAQELAKKKSEQDRLYREEQYKRLQKEFSLK